MGQKRFKFKLQSILDYKQQIEDEEKEKLAKLMQEEQKAKEYLETLKQNREREVFNLKEKQQEGTLNIDELKLIHNHIQYLGVQIENQKIKISNLQKKIEEQRQKLMEATKERKSYEKLKEKQQERFLQEIETEERKMIDELATTRHIRRQMQEKMEAQEEAEEKAKGI